MAERAVVAAPSPPFSSRQHEPKPGTPCLGRARLRGSHVSADEPADGLAIHRYHPYTIHGDGRREMAGEIHRLRERQSESEKITINVGFVDLGHIDLLVREGFYSNRTDFIRTAVRNQLASHADAVKQSIVRHTLELGLRSVSRQELEASKAKGVRLQIQVVGLATIDDDVTPELARETIESITVLGALHASKEIKSALADRIR
jgi:Arc/MetJ-type ribon-helix-helix transcriptional regulator